MTVISSSNALSMYAGLYQPYFPIFEYEITIFESDLVTSSYGNDDNGGQTAFSGSGFGADEFGEFSLGNITSINETSWWHDYDTTPETYYSTFYSISEFSLSVSDYRELSHVEFTAAIMTGADYVSGSGYSDYINGFGGADSLYGGSSNDTIDGGSGNDILYGDGGVDTLYGESGDDRLYGDADNDRLLSGSGNDVLYGGTGNDGLDGGIGNDLLYGDDSNDRLYGNTGNDTLYGGAGADSQFGGTGVDTLYGGAGNDTLYGSDGNDRLLSSSGNDLLYGGTGNDGFDGGTGNDRLYGGTGADRLSGGAGLDRLDGGADSSKDVFIFKSVLSSGVGSSKRDVISNFASRIDDISLSDIDANTALSGNQTFSFSGTTAKAYSVWYVDIGTDLLIRGDVNGNKTADFEIQVAGINSVAAGDFIL